MISTCYEVSYFSFNFYRQSTLWLCYIILWMISTVPGSIPIYLFQSLWFSDVEIKSLLAISLYNIYIKKFLLISKSEYAESLLNNVRPCGSLCMFRTSFCWQRDSFAKKPQYFLIWNAVFCAHKVFWKLPDAIQ